MLGLEPRLLRAKAALNRIRTVILENADGALVDTIWEGPCCTLVDFIDLELDQL